MSRRMNECGQPIGSELHGWTGVERPSRAPMEGRFCRIEALDADRHARSLFDACSEDAKGALWTYMSFGPFGVVEGVADLDASGLQERGPAVLCTD